MITLALEINDSDIIVGRDDGSWQSFGPGYALLDPGAPLLGEAARAQARLRPKRLHNRFWSELGVEPLAAPTPYAGSNADLACAQLREIWQQVDGEEATAAIFLVPGSFGRDALGLLLGIAGECNIPARGVVDTAVAAAELPGDGRPVLHLDVHLHNVILTEVLPGDGATRGELQISEAVGLAALEQTWAKSVAEVFIRQTRFDPLHQARSEQDLFDRLPGWLEALGGAEEIELVLEQNDRTLRATMSRRQMLDVAAPHYERIHRLVEALRLARGPVSLQLGHRAARLPGLNERLAALPDTDVVQLAPGRAVAGALAHRSYLAGGDGPVRYVTSLPEAGAVAPPSAAPASAPAADDNRPPPTHLLAGTVAYVLNEKALTIGAAPAPEDRGLPVTGALEGVSRRHCTIVRRGDEVVVEDLSRYGTFVNDRRIAQRATLKAGDKLRIGTPGSEFLLLEARD
jgi:hypothetical protein